GARGEGPGVRGQERRAVGAMSQTRRKVSQEVGRVVGKVGQVVGMESQTVTLSIEAPEMQVQGPVFAAETGVAGGPGGIVALAPSRPRRADWGEAPAPARGAGAERRGRGARRGAAAESADLVSAERVGPPEGAARAAVPIDLEALPLYLREISAGTLL